MFNRYKELREFLDGQASLISRLEQESYNKVFKKDLVECEGCGCLLMKNEKFKLESTVGKKVNVLPPISYSGYDPYPGRSYVMTLSTDEYIIEHYKCLRCQEKKEES